MKPTATAAGILITEDPHYPEGLYAYVDYDREDNSGNCRLK